EIIAGQIDLLARQRAGAGRADEPSRYSVARSFGRSIGSLRGNHHYDQSRPLFSRSYRHPNFGARWRGQGRALQRRLHGISRLESVAIGKAVNTIRGSGVRNPTVREGAVFKTTRVTGWI